MEITCQAFSALIAGYKIDRHDAIPYLHRIARVVRLYVVPQLGNPAYHFMTDDSALQGRVMAFKHVQFRTAYVRLKHLQQQGARFDFLGKLMFPNLNFHRFGLINNFTFMC